MSLHSRLLPLLAILCTTACGTFHSGIGAYKAPADYARGPSSVAAHYTPSGPFKLIWPVREVRVNRGYKPSSDPAHEGLDLGGTRGLPILAAHEGRVVYVGSEFRGYGKMVLLEYDREWATLYAHLDSFAVHEGQIVHAGDTLGAMGSTGHATGVHLHFEALHHRTPTNPLSLLNHSVASR